MKRIIQKLKGDEGAALVTALLFLVMLTMLGIFAIWTSSTETALGGNERLNKQAYYLAEAGLQEAISRLDVSDTGAVGYYIETNRDTVAGIPPGTSPYPWRDSTSTWSSGFKRTDGFTNYSVYIVPSFEEDSFGGTYHLYSSTPNYTDQMVLYNEAFKYPDSPLKGTTDALSKTGFPVFHVISVGRVMSPNGKVLAMAKIQADITENTMNVNAPGGLSSNKCTNIGGNSLISAPSGEVAVYTPCLDNISTNSHITGTAQTGNEGAILTNMSSFLGMNIADIRSMATMTYTGGSTETGVVWGNYATESNAQIIFADNACIYSGGGCTPGDFHLSGGKGYGILVVTGDLTVSGGFEFKGLVYVLGDFKTTGTGAHITGALMVDGDTELTTILGDARIELDRGILEKVSKAGFKSKMIMWREIRE